MFGVEPNTKMNHKIRIVRNNDVTEIYILYEVLWPSKITHTFIGNREIRQIELQIIDSNIV